MCSLPNGIRTGPVTNEVVAYSRDQPNQRAHSTNVGTVTTPHGLSSRIARNAWAALFLSYVLIPPDFVVGGMIAKKQVGWFNCLPHTV
jgi:hypothetical protein